MKRKLNLICQLTMGFILALLLFFPHTADANDVIITLDDQVISTDVAPVIDGGRTLLPIRAVSEHLGARVHWDNHLKMAIIENDSTSIVMTLGQNFYFIDGNRYDLDVPAQVVSKRTMVPLRAVGEALDLEVEWIGAERVVALTTDGYTPEPPTTEEPEEPNEEPENNYPIEPLDEAKTLVVTGSVVNYRQGPSTDYAILGSATQGTRFTTTAKSGDWYRITTTNGREAWIAGWLIGFGDDVVTPPPVQPPANNNGPQMKLTGSDKKQGESSYTFYVGSSNANVISDQGTRIKVRISDISVPEARDWVSGMAPFTALSFVQDGKHVIVDASVTPGSYLRIDRLQDFFRIRAVAKHKNGQKGLAGKTIVIDPGHGSYEARGTDYGARGRVLGLDEYTFNTPVALKLKNKLENAGAKVIMTREKDLVRISLAGRALLANDQGADAFISIHGDSFTDPNVWGSKVFFYDGSARITSAAQSQIRREFANVMNEAMRQTTSKSTLSQANFAVIREAEMPSVLIECGFLTNPREEALMATDAYQEKLAQAMFNGLKNYFAY